jgi:pyruvate dehydrogenase E2 component (dihydrolipoamide acetyltransferase)
VTNRIVLSVPDLGDFKDVEVIDVLVAEGDEVAREAPLVTLETDKATMDVPAEAAGRIVEIRVSRGDRVSKGDALAVIEAAGEAAAAAPAGEDAASKEAADKGASGKPAVEPAAEPAGSKPAPAAPAAATAPEPPAAAARVAEPSGTLPPIEEAGFSRAHAGPSVRRFARELGVDLGRVKGSGVKGRITHDDVKAWVKAALAGGATAGAGPALPRVPEVDFAAFGPVESLPLTRVQRISGPRLHASWVNIPHVTQHDEADITDLEVLRGELKERASASGIKLTPLAFILRACARVMADFPRFNASLAGEQLVLKKYLHLGFAADTPNGLVVPVIRDADRKDVYELARELAALSEKARAGKLAAAEMQGGCFTVSSLGGIGGTAFTPIINAPEVAILGVSKARMRPVWRDGEFVPRLMLPLSLSYDHRVIDGAEAVRFIVALSKALAEPRALAEAVP